MNAKSAQQKINEGWAYEVSYYDGSVTLAATKKELDAPWGNKVALTKATSAKLVKMLGEGQVA